MRHRFGLAIFLNVCIIGLGGVQAQVTASDNPLPPLRYLSEADVAPQYFMAAPQRLGSSGLKIDLQRLHATIENASPQRLAQAAADGENETPSAFADAAGVDFDMLPATRALLAQVTEEADAVVERGKRYFAQPRPYQIEPGLAHCGKPSPTKAFKGYPSGHAGFGYSTAWVLARLIPERAPQILSRADDYALSREICGSHFHADTEASHVIGTVVADRLLADPRLASAVAAARQELDGHKIASSK